MSLVSEQSDIPDRRVRSSISVFDMLKIGIGPSSSHTLGPWRAALRFLDELQSAMELASVESVSVDLFGSLAKTGRGHGTGVAIMMGLRGEDPETCEVDLVTRLGDEVLASGKLKLVGRHTVPFVRERDIRFNTDRSLDFHPNGMALTAVLTSGDKFVRRYFSIGGGFIVGEDAAVTKVDPIVLPYPIERASDLLRWTEELDCSIADVVRCNERAWRSDAEIDAGLLQIGTPWSSACTEDAAPKACFLVGSTCPGARQRCTRHSWVLHTTSVPPASGSSRCARRARTLTTP